MYNKILRKSILGFLIFGILLLSISIYFLIKGDDIDYRKTVGTITNIKSYYVGEDSINEVYVEYRVGARRYEVIYPNYDSSMKIGDKLVVLYNPEEPTFIQAEHSERVLYVVASISLIITIISTYELIKTK